MSQLLIPLHLMTSVPRITRCRAAERALDTSGAPSRITGRVDEYGFIKEHLDTAIKENRSSALYVSGRPGTGKSACLHLITKALNNPPPMLFINCMRWADSPQQLFREIAEEFSESDEPKKQRRTYSPRAWQREAFSALCTPTMKLLVLDEMDSLSVSVLYALFEWPWLKECHFILIGIANALDLTERLLPRLRRGGCNPTILNFAPYSPKELAWITSDRLKDTEPVLSKDSIDLCARRVAACAGDARKMLDISRRAIQMARVSGKQVGLPQMAMVLSRCLGRPVATEVQLLPLHPQNILGVLVKEFGGKDTTMRGLRTVYFSSCKSRKVPATDSFETGCQILADKGLVSIHLKRNQSVMEGSIGLAVEKGDVVFNDGVAKSMMA